MSTQVAVFLFTACALFCALAIHSARRAAQARDEAERIITRFRKYGDQIEELGVSLDKLRAAQRKLTGVVYRERRKDAPELDEQDVETAKWPHDRAAADDELAAYLALQRASTPP